METVSAASSLGWTRQTIRAVGGSLQSGLRQTIVAAIIARRLAPGQRMPSSRFLALQLGMARNTVTAVYEELATRGLLTSSERRGFFVATGAAAPADQPASDTVGDVDWSQRLATRVLSWRHITKASDWQHHPYPFLYGQVDPNLFPLQAWRMASRDALGRSAVNWWAADNAVEDDPLLIEQILRDVLPRRGVFARPQEVLITLGSQEGLYLLSRLLVRPGDVVGVEDPGYADARHIFCLGHGTVRPLPVDGQGVQVGPELEGVDLAVVTPACHCPTGVPLSPERRASLLAWAERTDGLIIEDDFEGEMALDASVAALKSGDRSGRVIYLGTFSKTLAPGMRLGYMTGPAEVIAEARALRRLIHRSPPLNNQRLAAIFMVEGHYQGLVRQLRGEVRRRHDTADRALRFNLPGLERPGGGVGSAIWLRCPVGVSSERLEAAALARGVLFERGESFFDTPPERVHLRLGLSTIANDRIEAGVEQLARALDEVR